MQAWIVSSWVVAVRPGTTYMNTSLVRARIIATKCIMFANRWPARRSLNSHKAQLNALNSWPQQVPWPSFWLAQFFALVAGLKWKRSYYFAIKNKVRYYAGLIRPTLLDPKPSLDISRLIFYKNVTRRANWKATSNQKCASLLFRRHLGHHPLLKPYGHHLTRRPT